MAKLLEIGVAGCLGWMPKASSNDSDRAAEEAVEQGGEPELLHNLYDSPRNILICRALRLVPAAQGSVGFKARFHQHGCHRRAQPKQEAPKGLRGTCEYNIGNDSRQKITEEKAVDEGESAVGLPASTMRLARDCTALFKERKLR